MDTLRSVLVIVGLTAVALALLAGVFIGLCLSLDRWVGIADVKRSDDAAQARHVRQVPPDAPSWVRDEHSP